MPIPHSSTAQRGQSPGRAVTPVSCTSGIFAALLRAPDALERYSSSRERRLQELADADDAGDQLAAGVTPVQAWAIGQAMLVGLQIEKRLSPGLVTPEVFERAFGLLAHLYQEQ